MCCNYNSALHFPGERYLLLPSFDILLLLSGKLFLLDSRPLKKLVNICNIIKYCCPVKQK